MNIPSIASSKERFTVREVATRWIFFFSDKLPNDIKKQGIGDKHYLVAKLVKNISDTSEVKLFIESTVEYKDEKSFLYAAFIYRDDLVELEERLFGFNEKSGIEFDSDREDYPLELDIAITAWRAVAKSGQGEGNTPRQRLEDWLKRNYKNLDNEEIGRIATVCNWDKGRGRKK